MIFSYYVKRYPYSLLWHLSNIFVKRKEIALYCGDLLDWYILNFLYDNLDNVIVIAKNKKIRKQLNEIGVHSKNQWILPKAVIMTRHAFHIFPCEVYC